MCLFTAYKGTWLVPPLMYTFVDDIYIKNANYVELTLKKERPGEGTTCECIF